MTYKGKMAYENLAPSLQEHLETLKTPLVNDLTTGGADAAVTAEQAKELNSKTDNHIDDYAKHLTPTQTARINNSMQVNQFNDTNTINMGKHIGSKTYYWGSTQEIGVNTGWLNTAQIEALHIQLPLANGSGMFTLKMTSSYNVGNAMGGAVIQFMVGKVGAQSFVKEMNILHMTPQFANCFHVNETRYYDNRMDIEIIKKPNTLNALRIELDIISQDFWAETLFHDAYLSYEGGLGDKWTLPPQQSIFTHVGNSKDGLAVAITGKGVTTTKDATFAQMIANINAIPTNKKATGNYAITSASLAFLPAIGGASALYNYVKITLAFEPTLIYVRGASSVFHTTTYTKASISEPISGNTYPLAKMADYTSGIANSVATYNIRAFVNKVGDNWEITLPVANQTVNGTVYWWAYE